MNASLRLLFAVLLLAGTMLAAACSTGGGATPTSDSRNPGAGRSDTRQIAPGVRSDVNRTGTGNG